MTTHDHEMPPVRLAFVIDNIVQDCLNTDERLAAIFLSNPTIVDISDRENQYRISIGSQYNPQNGEFTEIQPIPTSEDSQVLGNNGQPLLEFDPED
jgi:hypothetical protein